MNTILPRTNSARISENAATPLQLQDAPPISSSEEVKQEHQSSKIHIRRVRSDDYGQLANQFTHEIQLASDLSAISADRFKYLLPETARQLSSEKIAQLTAPQIAAMAWTTRIAFAPQQVAHISLTTWNELNAVFRKELIQYVQSDPLWKSQVGEKMKPYLLALPQTHLSELPIDIFQHVQPHILAEIFTIDKIPHLTPPQIIAIFKNWGLLTPEHIQAFPPEVFKFVSPVQLARLDDVSRAAINEAQLSQINLRQAGNFVLNLTDQQIPWLGTRVSEISPVVFSNIYAMDSSREAWQALLNTDRDFQREMQQHFRVLPLPGPHLPQNEQYNVVLTSIRKISGLMSLMIQVQIRALDAQDPIAQAEVQQQLVNKRNEFLTESARCGEQISLLEEGPLKQQVSHVQGRLAHWIGQLQEIANQAQITRQFAMAGNAAVARFIRTLNDNQVLALTGVQISALTPAIWGRIRDELSVEAQQYAQVEGPRRALQQTLDEARRDSRTIEWRQHRYDEIINDVTNKLEEERFIQLAKGFIRRFHPIHFANLAPEVTKLWEIPKWQLSNGRRPNVFQVIAHSNRLSVQSLANYPGPSIHEISDAVLEDLKERGVPFLERLSDSQLDWLTRNADGTQRTLPYTEEEIQAVRTRVRQPDSLFVIVSRSIGLDDTAWNIDDEDLAQQQIDRMSRGDIKKLLALPDWITSVSKELMIAIFRKYMEDREIITGEVIIHCARNGRFPLIPSDLRRKIHPDYFESFTLDNFWQYVIGHSVAIYSTPEFPITVNVGETQNLITELTAEQLSKCLPLFKARITSLLPYVSPSAVSSIPADAFRYLGELPRGRNERGIYINITPEKVRNLRLEQYASMPADVFAQIASSPLFSEIKPDIIGRLPDDHYIELNKYVSSVNRSFSKLWTPQQFGALPHWLFGRGMINLNEVPPTCLSELKAEQFIAWVKEGSQLKKLQLGTITRIRPEVFALIWKEGSSFYFIDENILRGLPAEHYEALHTRVAQSGESFYKIWGWRKDWMRVLPPEVFSRGFINLREVEDFSWVSLRQMKAWMNAHGNDLKWLARRPLQSFNSDLLNDPEILLHLKATQLGYLTQSHLGNISSETLRKLILGIDSADPTKDPKIKYFIKKGKLTEEAVRIAKMSSDQFFQQDLANIKGDSIPFISPDKWREMTVDNVRTLLAGAAYFGDRLTAESIRNLSPDCFAEIEGFGSRTRLNHPAAVSAAQLNALVSKQKPRMGLRGLSPDEVQKMSLEVFKNGSVEVFLRFSSEAWGAATLRQWNSIPTEVKRQLIKIWSGSPFYREHLNKLVSIGAVPEGAGDYAKMTPVESSQKGVEFWREIPGKMLPYLSEEVYEKLTEDQARALIRFPDVFNIAKHQLTAILQKYPALLVEPLFVQVLGRLKDQDFRNFWKTYLEVTPDLVRVLPEAQQADLVRKGILTQEQVNVAKMSVAEFVSKGEEFLNSIPNQCVYLITPKVWANISEAQWRVLTTRFPDLILGLSSSQFYELASARAAQLLANVPNLSRVHTGIFRKMTLDQWREWMAQPGFSLEKLTGEQLRAIAANTMGEYGIQLQSRLSSHQYWSLTDFQRDVAAISARSLETATKEELAKWLERISDKNLQNLSSQQLEKIRGECVTVRFLQEINALQLEDVPAENLKEIPRGVLQEFVRSAPEYEFESTNGRFVSVRNKKITYLVNKNILSESDIQVWKSGASASSPGMDFDDIMDFIGSLEDSQPATATKRKPDAPLEGAPSDKRQKVGKTVVLVVESETEGDEQQTQRQKALDRYLQKPRQGEMPAAYKLEIRSNGMAWYYQYNLPSRSYWPLEGPPQDLGEVAKFLIIGENKHNKIANQGAMALGAHVKDILKDTRVSENCKIVLVSCELPASYGSQFFQELSTEEVYEGASAAPVGRRVNPKYANLQVISYLHQMFISENGQRLVKAPDGKLYHGRSNAKFLFRRDDSQPGGVGVTLQATQGEGNAVDWTPEHAGPLGVALDRAISLQQRSRDLERVTTALGGQGIAAYEQAQVTLEATELEDSIKQLGIDIAALKMPPRYLLDLENLGPAGSQIRYIDIQTGEQGTWSGTEPSKIKTAAQSFSKVIEKLKVFMNRGSLGRGGKIVQTGMGLFGAALFLRVFRDPEEFKKLPLPLQLSIMWGGLGVLADSGQNAALAAGWTAKHFIKTSHDLSLVGSFGREAIEKLKTVGFRENWLTRTLFTVEKFQKAGVPIAEGILKTASAVGRALIRVNGGLLAGQIVLDFTRVVTAKDEEGRTEAGVSLGLGLGAGAALILGVPVVGLVLGGVSMGFHIMQEAKRLIKLEEEKGKKSREILAGIKQMYERGAEEDQNGVLRLDEFRVKSIDMQTGKIIFESPNIQGHRPSMNHNRNVFAKTWTTPKQKLFEALAISGEQTLGKGRPRRTVLPKSTGAQEITIRDHIRGSHWLTGADNRPEPQYEALESQLRSQEILAQEKRGKNGRIMQEMGTIADIQVEDQKESNIPLTIKLSDEESEWTIPPYQPQVGQIAASYCFEIPAEGTKALIQNFQYGVELRLKDPDKAENSSLIRITVPGDNLSSANSLNIEEKDGKKRVVLTQSGAGIDLSEIKSAKIQLIGKLGTWNIYPDGRILVEKLTYIGGTTDEARNYLKNLYQQGRTETRVYIERSDTPVPKPPTLVMVEKNVPNYPTRVETTTTTTAQTKTTIVEDVNEGYPPQYRRKKSEETVPTPSDDPYHAWAKEQVKDYNQQLIAYYHSKVSTDVFHKGQYRENNIKGARLLPGAQSPHIFYFHPGNGIDGNYKVGSGTLQRFDEVTNKEIRIEVPACHLESQIREVKEDGDRITFRRTETYSHEGRIGNIIVDYEWKAGQLRITKVSNLPTSNKDGKATLMGHIRIIGPDGKLQGDYPVSAFLESLGMDLTRIGIGSPREEQNSIKKEIVGWIEINTKDFDTGEAVRSYGHFELGQKVLVREDEELVAELSEGEEKGLIFHSAERKTALMVKMPKNGTFSYDSRADTPRSKVQHVIKSPHSGEVYLIEGKELITWNPFKNTISTLPVWLPEGIKGLNFGNSNHAATNSIPVEAFKFRPRGSYVEKETKEEIIQRISYGEQKPTAAILSYQAVQGKWQLKSIGPLSQESYLEFHQQLQQTKTNLLMTKQEAQEFLERNPQSLASIPGRIVMETVENAEGFLEETLVLLPTNRGEIKYREKYEKGRKTHLEVLSVGWEQPRDFKTALLSALKIPRSHYQFLPNAALWVRVDVLTGKVDTLETSADAYYVNTKDFRWVKVPGNAILIDELKGRLWDPDTEAVFLLPHSGDQLVAALNGQKVEPNNGGGFNTKDGREMITEIDQNGNAIRRISVASLASDNEEEEEDFLTMSHPDPQPKESLPDISNVRLAPLGRTALLV